MKPIKEAMLQALESTLGVVSPACELAGISRQTHYDWLKDDEEYAQQVKALEDVAIDFAESSLHSQIKDKNPTSTIFYLKTKGKKRGYVEKQEVESNIITGIKLIDD